MAMAHGHDRDYGRGNGRGHGENSGTTLAFIANEEQEAREMEKANVLDNDLSLQRVHNIIDRMSREEEPQVTKRSQVAKEFQKTILRKKYQRTRASPTS